MFGELFINVLKDILGFSLIEGICLSLFFYYVCEIKKMNWYEILIMSIGNAFISQMLPIVIYQIFMVIWMGIVLFETKKVDKLNIGIKNGILGMMLLLICEAFMSIIYNIINIDLVNTDKLKIFLYMIPIRFLEIFMIGGINKMKAWFGVGAKRK